MKTLIKDPLNIIIIGVAGQGNVVISMLVCNALLQQGYMVTFGQTYGANQRGGSVMNYVRVSRENQCSPLVPDGRADVILALEPVEALRMLAQYGNPEVTTIVNPRPIYSIEAARGDSDYPDMDTLTRTIRELSAKSWFINATEEAQKLGYPIVANVILAGALIGSGVLPLDKEALEPVIRERFPRAVELNMTALSRGMELAGSS
ncbi:MAG: indolepyruvate oxidoreductase subunit beta [Dehalococcoidales bacterium]|nr:indolepyruvate oxidoreductase subunit beta [Dehalococcoidales bacterium]